ncbi:MAG: ABC transporter permease [Dehalococcoidia bacterium]|nr:ABC transporter permease [Dehalococcoidia bacterium]MCA9854056.1 ABC transporter permease [Dehalococcoidia bacterium]
MTAAAQFETQLVRKRQSFWGGIGRALVRNHPFEFFISGVVIVVIFGLAILAPWIEPAAPEFQDARAVLESPSFDHPFGTDNIGRDVFSRVVHGARISLRVGFASVAIGITIATVVGAISGYFGGWVDMLLQRVVDTMMAFPSLVLILLVVAMFGNEERFVILAISIFIIAAPSRVVRAEVLSVKERQYIEAAQSVGCSNLRILGQHILPNIVHVIIVIASINIAGAILVEASLSFLGLGIPAPAPSWGNMISGQNTFWLRQAPWMLLFPGLALSLTVYAFNMMGDALRDVLDPRLRER